MNTLPSIDKKKIVRSQAPLRLGLGGGGTDIEEYYSKKEGIVLNSTISLSAYCTIIPNEKELILQSFDNHITLRFPSKKLPLTGDLVLLKAIYNYISINYLGNNFPNLTIITFSDVRIGSGLGTSSAIVVCVLNAFNQLYSLSLTKYQLANLAYKIEREICGFKGGKQDYFSSSYGGLNILSFKKNRTFIKKLKLNPFFYKEFKNCITLIDTGVSRVSSKIIEDQIRISKNKNFKDLNGIKKSCFQIINCLLEENIDKFFNCQSKSWHFKKKSSKFMINDKISKLEILLLKNNYNSFKVSGAGGGGFFMVFHKLEQKNILKKILKKNRYNVIDFNFTEEGTTAWTIKK